MLVVFVDRCGGLLYLDMVALVGFLLGLLFDGFGLVVGVLLVVLGICCF